MVDKVNAVNNIIFRNPQSVKNNSDKDFQNSIMTQSVDNITDNPINSAALGVCLVVGTIAQEGGPLLSFAESVGDKASAIASTYVDKIVSLNRELEAVKGNTSLSKEEIERKLKDIQAVIELTQKEGEAKEKVLQALVQKTPKLNSLLKTMQEKGIPTDELTTFLDDIVNNVDQNVSNFKADDNKGDSEEKIKKGALGKNSDSKLEKQKENTTEKIKEIDKKLNSTEIKEEKEKLKIEKEALNAELNIIEDLKNVFKNNIY